VDREGGPEGVCGGAVAPPHPASPGAPPQGSNWLCHSSPSGGGGPGQGPGPEGVSRGATPAPVAPVSTVTPGLLVVPVVLDWRFRARHRMCADRNRVALQSGSSRKARATETRLEPTSLWVMSRADR